MRCKYVYGRIGVDNEAEVADLKVVEDLGAMTPAP
jgi:hypothetical protein